MLVAFVHRPTSKMSRQYEASRVFSAVFAVVFFAETTTSE